jgi:hypothetical protein
LFELFERVGVRRLLAEFGLFVALAQGFDRLSPNGIQDFVGPDQPEVLFDSTLRGVKGQDGVIQSARRNR